VVVVRYPEFDLKEFLQQPKYQDHPQVHEVLGEMWKVAGGNYCYKSPAEVAERLTETLAELS
jgi:hypothetical protein